MRVSRFSLINNCICVVQKKTDIRNAHREIRKTINAQL